MCAFACAPCMRVLRVRERVPCAGPRHHWPSPASRACRPPKPRVRARWVRRRPCDARASRASPPFTPSSLARMVHQSSSANAHLLAPARLLRAIEAARRCGVPSEAVAHGAALLHKLQPATRCVRPGHPMPRLQPYPDPGPTRSPPRGRAPRRAACSRRHRSRAPAGRCELAALWEAALADLAPSLHGALLLADGDAMRALCWGVRGDLASRLDALGCTLLPLRHAAAPRWPARPRTPALGRAGRGGAARRRRARQSVSSPRLTRRCSARSASRGCAMQNLCYLPRVAPSPSPATPPDPPTGPGARAHHCGSAPRCPSAA